MSDVPYRANGILNACVGRILSLNTSRGEMDGGSEVDAAGELRFDAKTCTTSTSDETRETAATSLDEPLNFLHPLAVPLCSNSPLI